MIVEWRSEPEASAPGDFLVPFALEPGAFGAAVNSGR